MVSEKEKGLQDVKMPCNGECRTWTQIISLFKNFFQKNDAFNEKSFKRSMEESRIDYFRMNLLRYLVDKKN